MSDHPNDPIESSAAERAASALGKTPAEVAAWDRFLAGAVDLAVARGRLLLEIRETTGAMRNFLTCWQASEERLTVAEAQQIAAHPDLAEVNVRLDALYDL